MPRVEQTEQPRGTSTSSYSETPEQKRGWAKLADWVEEQLDSGTLIEGDVFKVKGYVQEMNLDPSGKFFTKDIKDRQTGAEKKTTYTQSIAVIDDRRFTPEGTTLPLPPKQLGTSFFDGRMRDGSRGIARGAMYHLHLAVTFQEPPADLVNNRGGWDTDDYTGPSHPVLLLIDFAGWEQEGSQYFNSRASLKVFLNRFERDPEARGTASPPTTTRGSGRSTGRSAGSTANAPSTPPAAAPWIDGPTESQDPLPNTLTGDDFEDAPAATVAQQVRASGGGSATQRMADVLEELAPPTGRGRSRATSASAGAGAKAAAAPTATNSGVDAPATERQVRFIAALMHELGSDEQPAANLTRKQASDLIEDLQRQRNAAA